MQWSLPEALHFCLFGECARYCIQLVYAHDKHYDCTTTTAANNLLSQPIGVFEP